MLLEEIIQRVQSAYSHGVQSSDSRLTNLHIYNKLLTVRAVLITQRLRKRQSISQWSYQTIPCIKLILAPIHECDCAPKGCTIVRSKYKIPKPLTNMDSHMIEFTSLDGSQTPSEVKWTALKHLKGNKYTGTKPSWFIRNEYLYMTDTKILDTFSVTGLFEDPEKVNQFIGLCECDPIEDCDSPMDRDFNIDADLIEPMIEIATDELIAKFYQTGEDRYNDAQDNNAKVNK